MRFAVTPYAGVWIEILVTSVVFANMTVTPYAGVWIEMLNTQSVPSIAFVTPYAGVWIEMAKDVVNNAIHIVTPYAGVWIEMPYWSRVLVIITSLPTRECGLKFMQITEKRLIYCHSLRGSVD